MTVGLDEHAADFPSGSAPTRLVDDPHARLGERRAASHDLGRVGALGGHVHDVAPRERLARDPVNDERFADRVDRHRERRLGEAVARSHDVGPQPLSAEALEEAAERAHRSAPRRRG